MENPNSPRSSSSDVSVDDLNASIREQVRAAVSRFAGAIASDQSDNELLDVPTKIGGRQSELERLKEERKIYQEQYSRLQEEVELMEDEMRRREEGGTDTVTDMDMERALFGLARSNKGEETGAVGETLGEGLATSREHEKSVKNLKARIKLNEAFNGIQFKSAEWEIVAKDEKCLHRKHVHTGSAHGFKFQVEYLVRETETVSDKKEGSLTVLARIIALSVTVDPRAEHDLQSFTSRVGMDFDLMKFYQTYVKYAILLNERQDSFAASKAKFGASVRVPDGIEGTRLNFRLKSGLSLFFSWVVSVSRRGFVDSSLGLQVKFHSEVSDEDRETVSHLPHLLQKMIRVQGRKKALLSVLALLQPDVP